MQYEIVSIFGDCIWNVFSNNHTVFNENFESYDFGSWRCSGGFIADVINKLQLVPEKPFGYMDFYMGNAFTEQHADLTPLYKFIFKKLKAKNLDWEFSFPQMGLVNFNHENEEPDDMKNYDAGEALKKEIEKKQKQNEINEFQQKLNKAYEEAYEKARYKKPSQEVMAYFSVYGHWPAGHPLA